MSISDLLQSRKHFGQPLRAALVTSLLWAPAFAQYVQQGPKLVGSGTVGYSYQGTAVALSSNGNTAVVGGPSDNNTIGATWIFVRNAGVWTQQGSKLVAPGGISQGTFVAVSSDGNTALVGGASSGGAWVYTNNGGVWSLSATLAPSATGSLTTGVALSADASIALVGNHLGAAVYTQSGGVWTPGPQLTGSGATAAANKGFSVAISGDGSTAILGLTNDTTDVGGAWIFINNNGSWSQQGSKLVGTGAVGNSGQGNSVALSTDGNTAIVGGPFDSSSAGAAWIFARSNGLWTQQGNKLTLPGTLDFGFSVSLTASGNTAVMGSSGNGASVWTRNGSTWAEQGAPLIGTGAATTSNQGSSVAFSGDGSTILSGSFLDNGVGATWVFAQSISAALQFVPLTPCRIADTRNPDGPFGGPALVGGVSRDFVIPSSTCGVPATALAYSLNVTVVPVGTLGFLTLWPSGEPQPVVSTLNSYDGRVKANAAIVGAGTNGAVSVITTDPTDVILDIDGYFVPSTSFAFYPLPPCRIADTRNPNGPFGGPFLTGNAPGRDFPILASTCGIPAGAQAYSLNFTAIPRNDFLGFLTTWPAGQPQPYVSTLNSYTGVVTANAAIVPAGTNGDIDVFVTDDADLVIDVNGYFSAPGAGGQSLYTFGPCRVLDTRATTGSFSGVMDVNVSGSSCNVPGTAQAYVFNTTVIPDDVLAYLTLWPQGQPQPYVSTLNSLDGSLTNNMAIVPTDNGSISAFATDSTQLLLDIFGYFAP